MATRTRCGWWALAIGLVLCVTTAPAWAVDIDGDGVDDAIDVCDNTPAGIAVDGEGRPRGDFDGDCDVDLDDFAFFQGNMTGPLAPPKIVIETVTVGNPGNVGELSGSGAGGSGPDRICGAVGYTYKIGKYEVTAEQYATFLNAVAATDTYGLYNTSMWSDAYGCKIQRNGSSGSYTYSVAPDRANRPVNYVSWGDAARFANWLHNGQPTGAQGLSTTEDGAYYLGGATSNTELLAVVRRPGATWVIPSEDEWYKAAYHKNDGLTGNYFDYPTSSDSMPSNDLISPDPGNNANFIQSDYTIDNPYWRTEVGEFENSESPYGTFDQGGNVLEWNEAILNGSGRGLRGGSFQTSFIVLLASYRDFSRAPVNEQNENGFRVCEVVPPAPGVVIETVPVGNPGNAGELSGSGAGGSGPDRICGAVGYTYKISKYEVTAGQYAAFLNAVAATDTYGLYNTSMWSDGYGCKIQRSGAPGIYSYSVAPEWANRPVNYVSWGDAARFANWLHNGQPTGAQDLSTTEDGAYYLNGATSAAALLAVTREPDWTWAITSEDEWYKAAYHKNDGVTGNYWDYPMGSSAAPNNGNPGGDTGNSANFFDGDYTIGGPYWRTQAGSFALSDSPYGTFDQGGNVWEWNEAILYGLARGSRGASFIDNNVSYLHASFRGYGNPANEIIDLGFRVSEVP